MADGGGTIEIAGKHIKKSTAAIGGVGIVGAAILYSRHKANAAGSSVATAASTQDPTIDPSTGVPWAEEDSGSGFIDPNLDSSSFTGGQVIGYDGTGNPIYGPTSGVTISGPGTFTNNAEWAQAFEQQVGSTGNDTVAAALGKYLTGQNLTSDQQTVVTEAIASQGYPPTAGPSGYPPSMKTAPVVNPPTTTTSGSGSTTVPGVVGLRAQAAIAAIQKAGLVAHTSTPIVATRTYSVNSQTPGKGATVAKGSTVALGVKTPA